MIILVRGVFYIDIQGGRSIKGKGSVIMEEVLK